MKKIVWFFLTLCLSLASHNIYAEEPADSPSPTVSTASVAVTSETISVVPPPPAVVEAPAPPAAPAMVSVPAIPLAPVTPVTSAKNVENLEFVSGEITGIDEATKTITVKLYGEAENSANDKILTIKLDETTDITDGEKDREFKSLTNGTEVDVEYDPATNKATYIFVY